MTEVQVLDVIGDARRRGEAHGEHMRDEIVTGVERWLEEMNPHQPLNPSSFVEHIQTSTRFFEIAEQLSGKFKQVVFRTTRRCRAGSCRGRGALLQVLVALDRLGIRPVLLVLPVGGPGLPTGRGSPLRTFVVVTTTSAQGQPC